MTDMSTETTQQALDHIQFQLSLLRLTATPLALGGPSAIRMKTEEEVQAERAMDTLTDTVSQLKR